MLDATIQPVVALKIFPSIHVYLEAGDSYTYYLTQNFLYIRTECSDILRTTVIIG